MASRRLTLRLVRGSLEHSRAAALITPANDSLVGNEQPMYWRFIDRKRAFFASNARLALMPKTLDRMDPDRRARIFDRAEAFIEDYTRAR